MDRSYIVSNYSVDCYLSFTACYYFLLKTNWKRTPVVLYYLPCVAEEVQTVRGALPPVLLLGYKARGCEGYFCRHRLRPNRAIVHRAGRKGVWGLVYSQRRVESGV